MSILNDSYHASTSDLGVGLKDHLEGQIFEIAGDDETVGVVDVVDASDPSNLIVALDNGQLFRVSVVAI